MWKIGIAVAVLTVAACEATYEERAAAFYKAQAICQAQVMVQPVIGAGQLQDRVDHDRMVECMIAHGIDGRTMYEHWKKGQLKFAPRAF